RQRLLPMAGPEAIGASVAAANNHYAFPSRKNIRVRCKSVSLTTPVLLRQVLHRVMDSLQFASRNFQITWLLRPAREHNRVKFVPQILHRNVFPDLRAGHEFHSLRGHLLKTAID